jgi:hypothetical protein
MIPREGFGFHAFNSSTLWHSLTTALKKLQRNQSCETGTVAMIKRLSHLCGPGFDSWLDPSSCDREGVAILRFPSTLHYKSPNTVHRANNSLVDAQLSWFNINKFHRNSFSEVIWKKYFVCQYQRVKICQSDLIWGPPGLLINRFS